MEEINELINDIIDTTRDIERGVKGARSERGHARITLERRFEAIEAELAAATRLLRRNFDWVASLPDVVYPAGLDDDTRKFLASHLTNDV